MSATQEMNVSGSNGQNAPGTANDQAGGSADQAQVESVKSEPGYQDQSQSTTKPVIPNYPANKWGAFLLWGDNYFDISKRGSKYTTEIMAGITTFLSMAYILPVNPLTITKFLPDSPTKGMLWNSIFLATAISSWIATWIMGFYARMPFALAPGMGLNFQVSLLIGFYGYTFGGSMAVVLLSGILFVIVTILGFREAIYLSIPPGIRGAISAGIGLFIAFIGMQNATLIVDNVGTLISLVEFRQIFKEDVGGLHPQIASAFVCLFGLFAIGVMTYFDLKGAVLFAIILATLLGFAVKVTPYENITTGWNIGERFSSYFSFKDSEGGAFGMFGPGFANAFSKEHIGTTLVTIVVFFMIDLFDTIGTLHGCAVQSGLVAEDGKVKDYGKCMWADSLGTIIGSILGTSTVTTYVESGTGISVGGRTGLSAVVIGALFFLSIFVSPIFGIFPGAATAAALIYVGVLMLTTVQYIKFGDAIEAIPIFLTIAMMPLTYSITDGIGIGFISFSIIALVCWIIDIIIYFIRGKSSGKKAESDLEAQETPKEEKEGMPKWPLSPVTCILTILFLIMFLLPREW